MSKTREAWLEVTPDSDPAGVRLYSETSSRFRIQVQVVRVRLRSGIIYEIDYVGTGYIPTCYVTCSTHSSLGLSQ